MQHSDGQKPVIAGSSRLLDQSQPDVNAASGESYSDLSAYQTESRSWRRAEGQEHGSSKSQDPASDKLADSLSHFQLSIDKILQSALSDFEQKLELTVDRQIQRIQQKLDAMSGKGHCIATG